MTQLPYQPIRSYDAPGVILRQLVDDPSFVPQTFREVMGGAPVVRPEARRDLGDAFRTGNPIADTLVGIASNPFTWLLLLTEVPVAGDVAGALFRPLRKRGNVLMRENVPVIHQLGAVTATQQLSGSAIPEALDDVRVGLEEFFDKTHKAAGNFRAKNIEAGTGNAYGSTFWQSHPPGAKRDKARALSTLLGVKAMGLNKARSVSVLTGNAKDGYKVSTRTFEPVVDVSDEALDGMIRQAGADPTMVGDARNSMNTALDLMLRTDGKFDPEKARRVYTKFSAKGAFGHVNGGDKALTTLFGPEVMEAVRDGKFVGPNGLKGEEGFVALLGEVDEKVFKADTYWPRNVHRIRKASGREVAPGSEWGQGERQGLLEVSGRLHSRTLADDTLDPDTVEYLTGLFGEGRMNREWVAGNAERVTKAVGQLKGDDVVFFNDIDFHKGYSRYLSSTSQTYAMHVRPVSAETQEAMRAAWVNSTPAHGEIADRTKGLNLRGTDAPLWSDPQKNAPAGGWTVADVLDQTYQATGDRAAKSTIKDVLVPRLMGRASKPDMLNAMIYSRTAPMAEGLSAAMKQAGVTDGLGKKVTDFLDQWVESGGVPLEGSPSFSRRVADYLYGTHLGVNIGSLVANASQPLVMTSQYVGAKDLGGGYVDGFRQMAAFMADMTKNKPRDVEGVIAAMRRNIPLADEAGITDSAQQFIDAVGRASAQDITSVPAKAFAPRLNRALLVPFTSVEIFNRVVSANAFYRRGVQQGRVIVDDAGQILEGGAFIRRGVQETQFGAELGNTPVAFLREGILSNPLARQFLQFPLRSATALFEVASSVELEGPLRVLPGGLGGVTNGLLRGAGYSAIAYETAKGLAGVDVSSLGFLESSTQLVRGTVDDRDGPLPIPPVLSIGTSTLKWAIGQDEGEFYRYTLPRLVPGGLQLRRALNLAPDASPVLGPLNPQSTYVGWGEPLEDGRVPVFRAQDNTLVDYYSPTRLLARTVGLDVGGFRTDAELDKYLLSVQERDRELRREAMTALMNGNVQAFRRVQATAKKELGYEVRISRQQIERARESRAVPRTTRILERTTVDAREQLRSIVEETRGGTLGTVPADQTAGP